MAETEAAKFFAGGDFAKVIESMDPSSEGDLRLAALACVRLGRFQEATERLDNVLSMGAHSDDAQLREERSAAAGQLALLRADAANDLFVANELDAALEAYNSVALADCTPAAQFAVLNNRGALHLQSGRALEALADFDACLKVEGPGPAGQTGYGKSVDALHNKGSALRLCGRPQDALEQFEQCLEIDQGFYLGACGRTECLSVLGRFDDAVESASQAITMQPDQPRAYVNKGFARLKGGKSQGGESGERVDGGDTASSLAVVDLECAVEKGDGSAETDKLLGLALAVEGDHYLGTGDDANALKSYEKALCHGVNDSSSSSGGKEETANINVLFNYSLAQLHLGQRSEALEGLKYVATLAAVEGKLLFEASWACGLIALQDGDAATAKTFLTTAVGARPENVDAQYNLGVANLKLGGIGGGKEEGGGEEVKSLSADGKAAALACFNKVLALDPSHALAKQAAALLSGDDPLAAAKEQALTSARQKAADATVDATATANGLSSAFAAAPLSDADVSGAAEEAESGLESTAAAAASSSPLPSPPPHTGTPSSSTPPPPPAAAAAATTTKKATLTPGRAGRRASFVTVSVTHPLSSLVVPKQQPSGAAVAFPPGVDPSRRETYLDEPSFLEALGCGKAEFATMPKWKQVSMKKEAGLF